MMVEKPPDDKLTVSVTKVSGAVADAMPVPVGVGSPAGPVITLGMEVVSNLRCIFQCPSAMVTDASS